MSDIVVTETWIVNQLAGIRSLEQELSVAMAKPQGRAKAKQANISLQMARLNAWVNLVDYALSVRATS